MQIALLPFLAISILLIVIPGPDTAVVTKNALLGGRRGGMLSAVGVSTGLTIWTLAAALGIAALLRASAVAFLALKLAGAVYLILIGVQLLRARDQVIFSTGRSSASGAKALRQGLLSDLGNPKIAVFFTSLLPQFVDADHAQPQDLLLLGLLFNCLGVVWLLIYADLAARGRNLLRRPRVKRALDRVTGVALVGLGVRLAFERR